MCDGRMNFQEFWQSEEKGFLCDRQITVCRETINRTVQTTVEYKVGVDQSSPGSSNQSVFGEDF